jgi:diguanylate cyclase (GGDEF)-like protein
LNIRSERSARRPALRPAADLISPRFAEWIGETRVARFGLLLIALDETKSTADALGAERSRRLTRMIAQRIRRHVRRGQVLELPRAGCFAALVRDPRGAESMVRLAGTLLEDLRRPWQVGEVNVQATASIGMCLFPKDGESLVALLHRADLALERARRTGGNTYEFYDPNLNVRLRDRWDVTARLWRAAQREEFTLAYQPLVNADTGAVVGAEALLRWIDGERGPQSPREFVPLLEHSALIVPVGEWVLRRACRQARHWLDAGLGRRTIAVNVSPHQFEQPDLVPRVMAILQETSLPPDLLLLEITENQLMRNPAQARIAVQALSALGVRVMIDDFGTGYSSISFLKMLPVKGIKIDRSFVAGLPHDRSDVLLTETVISLARTLGLELVAEGVETREQAAFLRGRKVGTLQGYLFGRPVPEEEFEKLLHDPASLPVPFVALTDPHPVLQ